MKRAILMLFIASLLAGCKSQTPTVDPFFGRTTVPPPSTGSCAGRNPDPYYSPTTPQPSPSIQPNSQYNYPGITPSNPGVTSNNPTNTPAYGGTPPYAGSNWPNSSATPSKPSWMNPQQYSAAASSPTPAPSPATNSGATGYLLQPTPKNNPGLISTPSGYPQQAPYTQPNTQPYSSPSAAPASTLPGGNAYPPAGSGYNYQGTSTGIQNSPPASTSPYHVSTPYFAGGVPKRNTIPVVENNTQSNIAGGNPVGAYPNNYSYQNGTTLPPAYNPTATASSANNTSAGQSPLVQTIQPQPRDKSYSQGYNFMPASRRYSSPTPAQPANNAPQPTWRESSSNDTRTIDDNIEPVSNNEAKSGE